MHRPSLTLPDVFLRLGIILIVILAAYGCSDQIPRLERIPENATVLAFGDSLTFGTGVKAEESYPAVLEQLTRRTVINAGNPGEVSKDGLQRLPDLLEEHRPKLVILCHAGNDMLRQYDLQQARQNLGDMIKLIHSYGADVVLLGVPKPKLLLLSSADFYLTLAEELNVPIEAEIIPTVLGNNALKSDQIHPNAAGYEQIANAVHDLLRKTGAIQD